MLPYCRQVVLFVLLFLVSACSTTRMQKPALDKETAPTVSETKPALQAVPAVCFPEADILAKQLAALEKHASIPDASYEEYKKTIEEGWGNFNANVLEYIKDWQQKQLVIQEDVSTVFYPFGGPDATYVTLLLPQATHYISVGLELLGNTDNVQYIVGSSKALNAFHQSMQSFLTKGYFITSEMMTQLYSIYVKGVLPELLFQLKKLGHTILQITPQYIAATGEISPEPSEEALPMISIRFRTPQQQVKTFSYIRCSLSNDNEKGFQPLLALLQQRPFMSFMKSASYALHNAGFSQIRNFILHNARGVLQDDTGIPYRYVQYNWNMKCFGQYTPPVHKAFVSYNQPKLQRRYAKEPLIPLPFRFGYCVLKTGEQARPAHLFLVWPKGTVLLEEILDDSPERPVVEAIQSLKAEEAPITPSTLLTSITNNV